MSDQPFLCCLIIIWADKQKAVCSHTLCFLGHHNGSFCAVGACTCHHRNPFIYLVDGIPDSLHMFLMRESRRFSGSSADDHRICSCCDLLFQDFPQLLKLHVSVFLHCCDNRYTCTFKYSHISSSFCCSLMFSLAWLPKLFDDLQRDHPVCCIL